MSDKNHTQTNVNSQGKKMKFETKSELGHF